MTKDFDKKFADLMDESVPRLTLPIDESRGFFLAATKWLSGTFLPAY